MEFEGSSNFFELIRENGLNLLLGAGFSVEAVNSKNESLPLGNALKNKLIETFSLPLPFTKKELSFICSHLKRNRQGEFNILLKDLYSVIEFHDAYKIIPSLPVRNIITTNIDNLLEKIFDSHSKLKLLHDVEINGHIDGKGTDLFKLHGSVTYTYDKELIFGTEEMSTTILKEPTLMYTVAMKIAAHPTLIWGHNISDSDIISIISKVAINNRPRFPTWIVILPGVDFDIDAEEYTSRGFRVIRATTKELLQYLEKNFSSKNIQQNFPNNNDELLSTIFPKNNYSTLKNAVHPVRPVSLFYQGSDPTWYEIFSAKIPKLSFYEKFLKKYKGNNFLISGSPGCGKSTLLMQIFASEEIKGSKLFFSYLVPEQVKLLKTNIKGNNITIFLDNLSDNIEAFKELKENGFKIIAADRDFNFEQVKYWVKISSDEIFDISNLPDFDIQNICNAMQRPMLKYTREKISLFEIVYHLWQNGDIKSKVEDLIKTLGDSSAELLEFYTLLTYMRYTNIGASLDMLISYYSTDDIIDYQHIYALKKQIESLVDDMSYKDNLQDLYSLRSRAFAEISLFKIPSKILAKVLWEFHKNINKGIVYRYDIFKKKAFDADLTRLAFDDVENGKEFYNYLLSKTINIRDEWYIKHQFAIYLWRKKANKEAWEIIDEAYTQSQGKVFSINNTHSMILFDNNIHTFQIDNKTSVETISKSFSVLEDCLLNDDRKSYHLKKYCEQAIQLADKVINDMSIQYLSKAKNFVEVELSKPQYFPRDIYQTYTEFVKIISAKLRVPA